MNVVLKQKKSKIFKNIDLDMFNWGTLENNFFSIKFKILKALHANNIIQRYKG